MKSLVLVLWAAEGSKEKNQYEDFNFLWAFFLDIAVSALKNCIKVRKPKRGHTGFH